MRRFESSRYETYHRQKTTKIVEDYLAHVDEFKEKNLPGFEENENRVRLRLVK